MPLDEATLDDLGSKIADYVGTDADALNKANKALGELKGEFRKQREGAAAKGKIDTRTKGIDIAGDTVTTFIESYDAFKNGTSTEKAKAAFDVIGDASQLLALTGPQGKVAASVIGSVCSILGAIFGTMSKQGEAESTEQMLERVIEEALAAESFAQLKDQSYGMLDRMKQLVQILDELSCSPDGLSEDEKHLISDFDAFLMGTGFLGALKSRISSEMSKDEESAAERAAKLISCYVQISSTRTQLLFRLACLWFENGGDRLGAIAIRQCSSQRSDSRKFLGHFLEAPTEKNHLVYGKLHTYLVPMEREILEAFLGPFEGRLCRIYNDRAERWLYCDRQDDRVRQSVYCIPKTDKEDPGTLFRVFGLPKRGWAGKHVTIFSCKAAGYVYADDKDAYDKDRRIVVAWGKGEKVDHDSWAVAKDAGKEYCTLKNEDQGEFLFASKLEPDDNRLRVFTWRPGNKVKDGHWKFQLAQ